MFKDRKPNQTATQRAKNATTGSYMAELDSWLEEAIFEPIQDAITSGDAKELHTLIVECKQLIKRRVIASYHNGLRAKTSNPQNNGQPNYRRN